MGVPTITREQIAEELSQRRTDGHTYFFLLISATNSSSAGSKYTRIVENAVADNNEGDWKKVFDLPGVRYYFGHFPSRNDAANNRLGIVIDL
jgi:hypothetical protein